MRSARRDQGLPQAMQGLHGRLRIAVEGHEAHHRTLAGLRPGFGVVPFVPLAIDIDMGRDVLGGHQPRRMPLGQQGPDEIVGAGVGLHADRTSRPIG